MNEKLRQKLDLFILNTQVIKGQFFWQNTMLKRLAALLYAAQNKNVDCNAIRVALELIKQNTGTFSMFRGNSALSIATLLSLSDRRNELLLETISVYNMMKGAGFKSSDYLVIAAYQIASGTSPEKYLYTVNRAKAFYDHMKSYHWFLTGQDDYIFSAMLGLSDVNVEQSTARMEMLYTQLKTGFFLGNGVQSLSQVLVLGNEPSDSAARVLTMRDAFNERGLRLDRQFTLSSLGVLSLLPDQIETIVNSVQDTYEYLRISKGFGMWSVTKQELLLLSASIVAFSYVDSISNGLITSALSTSITNIIIAESAAIAAAAASSAAATSASN